MTHFFNNELLNLSLLHILSRIPFCSSFAINIGLPFLILLFIENELILIYWNWTTKIDIFHLFLFMFLEGRRQKNSTFTKRITLAK